MEKYLVLATFVGSIIALLFVVITAKKVLRFSEGTPLMQKISQSIRQGANAYLKRQYSVVGVFFACMVVVLNIMDVLFNETHDSKYRANVLIRKMVRAGKLGIKSGEGFFKYTK